MSMEFYRNARYFSSMGPYEDHVVTTCGIKQGCTLAPYLFVIHTLTIIEEIGNSLGRDWMKSMLTFFADDSIGTWEVHHITDLKNAFEGIEKIISIFNQYGMKLSNDKCVILYDLQGREAHKFLSKRKHKRNKIAHFKFNQMGEDLWVPIKKIHEYLGTIIAYRDAPARTCAHRMKKARGQYSQLRKTINTTRIVSNRPRYQIWRSGVLSSATYGILATGVTYTSKRSLQAMAARQVRAIAKRPAHLTHITNEQVRTILHADDPLDALARQGDNLLAKLIRIRQDNPADIRGSQSSIEQLQYVLDTIKQAADDNTNTPAQQENEVNEFKCQHCEKSYTSITSLKKHMAISHKIKLKGGITFDASKHAIGNLPQCAYCGRKFDEWHGLKMHIERVNCPKLMMGQLQAQLLTSGDAPVVEPPRVTPLPAHENPEINSILVEKGWKALMDTQHAQHFAQHCCLCNRWVRDPTAVKRRLSQAHQEQWKVAEPHLETRCAEIKTLLVRDGICPWCKRVSYSRHFKQCNIVFQCALLGLLQEHGGRDLLCIRQLDAGTGSSAEREPQEAQRSEPERRAAEQTAPTDQTGAEKPRPEDPAGQHQQRGIHPGGPLSTAGGRPKSSPPRQLTYIPSRANGPRCHSQVAVRSREVLAREEESGDASAGPQNRGVCTTGHGDEGQALPLHAGPRSGQSGNRTAGPKLGQTVRVSKMESKGAKTRVGSRTQSDQHGASPRAGLVHA